jgi:chemotaxis protein methyltransferase CheR
MSDPAELDKRTFEKFATLIYDHVGIVLNEKKEALVSARLGKRMRSIGINDYKEYYEYVKNDESDEEIIELLNAISTNVTHFYREPRHFDLLGPIVREWEKRGQTRFRVWCAASSTGEEPYTIAITIKDALHDVRDVKILATDISTKVLDIAKKGVYEARHVEKIPRALLAKHFRRETGNSKLETGGAGSGVKYQVSDDMRRMIKFGRLNLMKTPYPMQGPLDIVFCRNVMIYFDNNGRKGFLAEAYRLLKPGGYLMVGHAESLSGILSNFKSVEPSVYVKG